MSISVYPCVFSVYPCAGAALRLVAGSRVIVVSHATETQAKLEALQREFVAAVVKRAERIWTQQMKEEENGGSWYAACIHVHKSCTTMSSVAPTYAVM